MPKFKPLPPGAAQRMIQGVQDELTPLAEERMARIKAMSCPRCHTSMAPRLHSKPFSEHDPLPRTLAACQECGAEIDPVSGIVINTGDPRKVPDPEMFVKRHDDDD